MSEQKPANKKKHRYTYIELGEVNEPFLRLAQECGVPLWRLLDAAASEFFWRVAANEFPREIVTESGIDLGAYDTLRFELEKVRQAYEEEQGGGSVALEPATQVG